MSSTRSIATLIITLALALGAGTLAAQSKRELPASVGDLSAAQLIEVKDQAGQVLLHGTFKTKSNEAKETERKADLNSPTGQKAKGKVAIEVEYKDGVAKSQELEVEVEQLPVMVQCELFVDGKHAGSFLTSKAGKAKVKFDGKVGG
jgi:hypothetical protein